MSSSSCCVAKFENGKDRVEDDTFVYYPHFVGNGILLCGKRSSRFPFQLFVGPEWYCMAVTYTLIIVPTFFFLYDVGTIWGAAVLAIGIFSGLSTIILFTMTACTDPGIIFEYPQTEPENQLKSGDVESNAGPPGPPPVRMYECGNCKIKRPQSASHCYECGVCVDELDHHCPWTGKCIGKKNIKTFFWFLSSLSFHIVFVLAATIYSVAMKRNVFTFPAN